MIASRTAAGQRLRVLQVGEDREVFRLAFEALSGSYAIEHRSVSGEAELRAAIRDREWDVVLCDPVCREGGCRTLIPLLRESGSNAMVIALTDEEDEALAAEMIRLGARAALGRARLGRLVPVVARELDEVNRRRLLELRALLDSSPDPMLIADSEGRIRDVNSRLTQLLGYSAAELVGQPVEMLVPEALRERHIADRTRYASRPVPRPMGAGRELTARHKDGSHIPVDVSLGPLRVGGEQLVCCGLRDLRERVRAERLLRAILEGTATHTGEEFLHALVKNLALALEVRYAFVSELPPHSPGRARVLAFWSGDRFAPPHDYGLDTSPCGEAIRKAELFVASGVCARFPHDARLKRLGCEGFFAVRLSGASGEPLGVLAVADVAPLAAEATVRTLVRIFGARAGAELERVRLAAQLAERERWFRDMAELSSDWYWEQDAHFRFVRPQISRVGFDPWAPWFLGKTRWEAAPDGLSAEQWAEHRRCLEAREEFRDFEYLVPLPDGQRRWASVSGRPVYDESGRFRGYRGIAKDITGRKLIEQMLLASEARFREIFRAAPDAMTLVRAADATYLDVNEAFEEMTGYCRQDVLGRTSRDIGLWAEPARREDMFRLLVREGKLRNFDYVMRRRDGSTLHTALSAGTLRLAGEHCYLFVIRDVSARRRAEEELRIRNRALDASINAILITRSAAEGFAIVHVNPAFERITGYTAQDALGRNPRFLHGEDRDQPGLKLLRAALREEREATVLVRNYRKGGTPFWSELRVAPVRDRAGKVTHYVGIAADVTARVEAERRLQALAAELERRVEERTRELAALVRELESFSYTVSHDLRAPLRAIVGFAHLLREESGAQLSSEALRLLGRIEANALDMAAMIDGLLALARHSRQPLAKKTIDVNALVRQALEALQDDPQARRAEFVIGALPVCHADPLLLLQVYANLLSNAVKYSGGRARPRIEIGALREGGEPVYYVRDNGVGFDMRYAGRLFGVFERLHSASEFPGIGIGLSAVRRIIERHGGRIWAEAAPGEGATFFFTLGREDRDGS